MENTKAVVYNHQLIVGYEDGSTNVGINMYNCYQDCQWWRISYGHCVDTTDDCFRAVQGKGLNKVVAIMCIVLKTLTRRLYALKQLKVGNFMQIYERLKECHISDASTSLCYNGAEILYFTREMASMTIIENEVLFKLGNNDDGLSSGMNSSLLSVFTESLNKPSNKSTIGIEIPTLLRTIKMCNDFLTQHKYKSSIANESV